MKLSQFLNEEKKYGKAEYPEGYMPGIKVPKGGSMCANCEYWIKDGNMCKNKYWLKWHNGDAKIPEPADQYCCDWWHKA